MGRSPFHRAFAWAVPVLTVAASLDIRTSFAGDDPRPSECPSPDEVLAGLGQVLEANPGDAPTAGIVIRDHGTTWDIQLRGRIATYSDPRRDCAERARVATVFAALVLEPLDSVGDAGIAPVLPRPPTTSARSRSLLIEVAPLFALAPGDSGTPIGFGGQLRAGLVRERLSLSVGAEWVALSKLELGEYGVDLTRATFDLSARLSWRSGPILGAGELGPFVAPLRVHGTGLLEDNTSTHIDAGLRAAFLVRLATSRLSPFFALQCDASARRIELTVDPSGAIGQAPRVWLGFLLGGALEL